MTSPPPITRDGAAQAARHELSKSVYHRGRGDPLPVRVIHAIGRFIDHLLNKALQHTPGGGFGALLLLAVIAAIVGLVIWRAGLPGRNAALPSVFLAAAPIDSAADHRLRSTRAADEQDWETAVVERMRAVARELEERGVLDQRPGRTASELAADAATRLPAAGAILCAAAETFNAVAYGGADAHAADLAEVIAADDAVRATAGRLVSA